MRREECLGAGGWGRRRGRQTRRKYRVALQKGRIGWGGRCAGRGVPAACPVLTAHPSSVPCLMCTSDLVSVAVSPGLPWSFCLLFFLSPSFHSVRLFGPQADGRPAGPPGGGGHSGRAGSGRPRLN